MSYDTLYFGFFVAVVWAAYRMFPSPGWVLLVASIAFYLPAGLHDSMLAAALVLVNYAFQFGIARDPRWLFPALVVNFGCLAYFKYRAFVATSAGFDVFSAAIVIPLGISFYVFQLSALLIDISRGQARPFRSLPQFALFKLFFGQLIAGPIMRWRAFAPQVRNLFENRQRRQRLFELGLALCLMGLFKKIVLADSLAPHVNTIFQNGPGDAATAWLGVWLFSFQIYFDFSGYCDIALGLGHLFGLRLAMNFRQPFLSASPTRLWLSWNITLTQWFRDYVFTPLARRFHSPTARAAALLATMTLAGLWHGANWTFVLWGFCWGVALLLWRSADKSLALLGPLQTPLVFLIWLALAPLFRSADVGSALVDTQTLFGADAAGAARMMEDGAGGLLILSGCLALYGLHWVEAQLYTRRATAFLLRNDGTFVRTVLIGAAFWLLVLPKAQNAPFIYYRF